MTIENLLSLLSDYQWLLLGVYLVLPLLAAVLSRSAPGRIGKRSNWGYTLSTVVFAAAIPGIFAVVLIVYSLFFLEANLLQVNVIVYYLPVISMIATLGVMASRIDLARLPGFERLQGLLVLLGMTFVIWFLLLKLRVWVVFGGSVIALAVGALLIYVVLHWSWSKISKG